MNASNKRHCLIYQLHHIIDVDLEHVDALAEILPPTVLSPVLKNAEVTELLLFDQVRLAQKRETSVLKQMKYATNYWRKKKRTVRDLLVA